MRSPDGWRTRKPGRPVSSVGARGALRRQREGDDARPEAGVRAVRPVKARAARVLGPPALGVIILGFAVDTWATVAVAIGTIGAVVYAHVDLAGDDPAPLQLDLNPKPTGNQDLLEPGTYEISIEIRARNADALRDVVPVSWDGQPSDRAAMWDHLRVEPRRRVP